MRKSTMRLGIALALGSWMLLGCSAYRVGRTGEVHTRPAPDLDALLDVEDHEAWIRRLTGADAEQSRAEITRRPEFRTLLDELVGRGYTFRESFDDAEFSSVSLQRGSLSTTLTVGSFASTIKGDTGTKAVIAVALDRETPERSLFMCHVSNVLGLEPEQVLTDVGVTYNNEPWFTVQIGNLPGPETSGMQVGAVIWFRYWWYDSHHHKNWWYGPYVWHWRWYRWHGLPWIWWYDWWWSYYHWRYWWYWSKLWVPWVPVDLHAMQAIGW